MDEIRRREMEALKASARNAFKGNDEVQGTNRVTLPVSQRSTSSNLSKADNLRLTSKEVDEKDDTEDRDSNETNNEKEIAIQNEKKINESDGKI